MNQRGIAPLIILLIIAVVGTTSYFLVIKPSGFLQKQIDNIKHEISPSVSPTPTPTPPASLKGTVIGGYYSKPIANVEISIKNNGFEKKTKSSEDGSFVFKEISPGSYDLSFSSSEYSFTGQKIDLKEGENTLDKNVFGALKNPKPLTLKGLVFSDKNSNGLKDGSDTPLDAILFVYEKSSGTLKKTIKPDYQGNFSDQILIVGTYQLQPGAYTFYKQPGEVEFVVDGYGGTKTYNFAYVPTVSQAGFKIYVFNDKNENSIRDSDEEFIHYQHAKITNTSGTSTSAAGNTWNVAVSAEGDVESSVNYGNYTIQLEPDDSSWSYYYKITKGQESLSITATSGIQIIYLGAHKLY